MTREEAEALLKEWELERRRWKNSGNAGRLARANALRERIIDAMTGDEDVTETRIDRVMQAAADVVNCTSSSRGAACPTCVGALKETLLQVDPAVKP